METPFDKVLACERWQIYLKTLNFFLIFYSKWKDLALLTRKTACNFLFSCKENQIPIENISISLINQLQNSSRKQRDMQQVKESQKPHELFEWPQKKIFHTKKTLPPSNQICGSTKPYRNSFFCFNLYKKLSFSTQILMCMNFFLLNQYNKSKGKNAENNQCSYTYIQKSFFPIKICVHFSEKKENLIEIEHTKQRTLLHTFSFHFSIFEE